MKLAIGADEAAFELKEAIKTFLAQQTAVAVEYTDFGVHSLEPVDYPDIALAVAQEVASGRCERGVLLCGTGLGMAIAANKVPGIRAATCHDTYSAERAQKSNNAQIITLGARVIGPELAKQVVMAWLTSEFAGGGSSRKVANICAIEESFADGAKEMADRNLQSPAPKCANT
jgi:ribose 5-phosphate isomerase B